MQSFKESPASLQGEVDKCQRDYKVTDSMNSQLCTSNADWFGVSPVSQDTCCSIACSSIGAWQQHHEILFVTLRWSTLCLMKIQVLVAFKSPSVTAVTAKYFWLYSSPVLELWSQNNYGERKKKEHSGNPMKVHSYTSATKAQSPLYVYLLSSKEEIWGWFRHLIKWGFILHFCIWQNSTLKFL